jgi:hypothetical protein
MSGADPWAPVTIAYTYEEGGTHAWAGAAARYGRELGDRPL